MKEIQERILLLPGANGTELVRMMARFGHNTLGLRIMNGAEFARFALMRSGIVLKENFLPRKQEAALIDGFIRKIPYFAASGYADSEKIADSLYTLRSLIPGEESRILEETLPKGEFPEKNEKLLEVYHRYLDALTVSGSIDTIGLLRKALAEAKPLSCPVYTLDEYPLTPLEDALVSHLAADRVKTSLPALLGAETDSLRNIDYTASYGSSNEVAAIYQYIVEHNIPFDECTVAAANPALYAQLFFDFAHSKGLPVTFGCGIPIANTNPAKLLTLLYGWSNTGYCGIDALKTLLHSDALDRKKLQAALGITGKQLNQVIQIAGNLRLGFDRVENDKKLAVLPPDDKNAALFPAVGALSAELTQGESYWIKNYTLIRKSDMGRIDLSAQAVICNSLDAYAKYSGSSSLSQIIPELLHRSVCSENSREGALFVTGISGAMASMRKHLFVAGLSAGNFPGSPQENHLLLDSDFDLFGVPDAPTSINRVQQNKDTLNQLINLASALNVETHLSYSSYNLAEMKAENPSSALFDIYKKQNGDATTLEGYKKALKPKGYFDHQLSGDYTVGKAYIAEKEINPKAPSCEDTPCGFKKDIAYSPSALHDFFNCPRKFFLTRLLGVKQVETDDPFTVLKANVIGTLAHDLMEQLAHKPCDKATFLQRAEDSFRQALQLRPPLHSDTADTEKRIFLKMMENAYDGNPNCEVVSAEEEKSLRHSSGILLHGYPDRVEKISENEYRVVDYKTGKQVEHEENDIHTCLQTVIYAYLLDRPDMRITSCEYRYIRIPKTIYCRYDEDMKAQLDAKLQEFKEALDTGNFPCATEEKSCRYCTLQDICGKETPKEEVTE